MTLLQLFTRLVNRQQIPSESTRWWKSRSSTRRRGRQRMAGVAALESRVLLAADLDDQISEAALVGLGQTLTGIIDVDTDVDMRAFTVVAGQSVAFDLDTQGLATPLTDSVLRLFNAVGTELAVDDDTVGPAPEGNVLESFLSYTFATGGTYYIGVSGFNNFGYNPTTGNGDTNFSGHTGNYELRIGDPDDQISEAPLVGLDQTLTGIIDVTTDVDVWAFTVVAGQTVTFDLDTQGLATPLTDSVLRLFNTAGTQLAEDDDTNGPAPEGNGLESYLSYTFATGGTYYIGVSAFNNFNYNPTTGDGDTNTVGHTGNYELRIGDPDDQISEAPVVTLHVGVGESSSSTDTISHTHDVDMRAITVVAGQALWFDIDTQGLASPLEDSILRLFNAAGTELASSDDHTGPEPEGNFLESFLSYTFATGGTYYIGVSAYDNINYNATTGAGDAGGSSTGAYTLNINPADFVSYTFVGGVLTVTGTALPDQITVFSTGGTVKIDANGTLIDTGRSLASVIWISVSGLGGSDYLELDSTLGTAKIGTLLGGDQDDYLVSSRGWDTLNGGNGNDWVDYSQATAAVKVSLALATAQATGGAGIDKLAGVENLWGSNFADTFTGNSGANILYGNGGNDILTGGAGDDFLEGGLGNDKLTGGIGNDTVSYLTADAGVTVNLVTHTATGGAGSDTLATIENVYGSDFADTIIGDAFNNILRGFGGVDSIIGGGGVDSIIQN